MNNRLNGEDDRRQAKDNLLNSQLANKARLDTVAVERKLSVGDLVLMKVDKGKKAKMRLKWHGPYKVVGCSTDKNYLIEINGAVRSYHIDLLKLYKGDESMDDDDEDSVSDSFINSISYMTVHDQGSKVNVSKKCDDPDVNFKIDALVSKYSDLFCDTPTVTNVLSHKISVLDSTPVKKSPYSVPLAYKDKFKAEIGRMLNADVIEPSDSEYSSPCIVIPRKDKDEIRIVIDYISLNSKLVKDREPISNVKSIFARISNCKYFSVIDLKNGFWQIPLDAESRKYTAFITEFGLYQFKVLPFGISNGPAEFSRLMRGLFSRSSTHIYLLG